MFDDRMRLVKDKAFAPVARLALHTPPWFFTAVGLLAGLATAGAVWQKQYGWGLLLWFANRIFDGLDGAVARQQGSQTDFGGYLDIVVDFVIYALVPVGLAAGVGETAVTTSLIFLLCTYYVNAASWMYLAAILEKRQAIHHERLTAIVIPNGLIGGTETILFYAVFILFPPYLTWLFSLMGLLILITIGQRLVWASRHLN